MVLCEVRICTFMCSILLLYGSHFSQEASLQGVLGVVLHISLLPSEESCF